MFVCPSGIFFFGPLWTYLRMASDSLWAGVKNLWMAMRAGTET